jgi:hypothetical protein
LSTKQKQKNFKKKHRFLIFHDSWLGIIWNTIISICLLYTAFVLPVQIAFYPNAGGIYWFLEIFTTVIFIFDVLVHFNRSYLDKNKAYVVSRKEIAKKYLKFWFWIDFIACFPIQFIAGTLHPFNQQIKLLKMNKVFNLIRIFRVIEEMKQNLNEKKLNRLRKFFRYIKTGKEIFYMQLFVNIITIHNCACIVYYVPVTYSSKQNWVLARKIENRSEFEKYLFSLHWVIETFITVGFGENIIT